MPREHHAIALRCSLEYRRFLDRLAKEVKAGGTALRPGPNALAEYAIAALGLSHGLEAPPRMPPAHRPKRAEKG